jgi:CheY-like chemotaxis protein
MEAMQRRMHTQISRNPSPNAGPTVHTAVLVVAGNRAVRARLVSDLKRTGYIVYGANKPAEALRLIEELGHVDVLLCDTTASSADGVTHLATQALAIQPTLKVIGIFRRGRATPGDRHPAGHHLWLEALIEAVLEGN